MVLIKSLSLEERDALLDVLTHEEGWRALMKIVEGLTVEQEQAILKMDIAKGAEALFHERLKAEGARKLRVEIGRLKKAATKKEKEQEEE
jgi:hypothetical protein